MEQPLLGRPAQLGLAAQLQPWLIPHPHGGFPKNRKYKTHQYIFSLKGMVTDTGALTVLLRLVHCALVLALINGAVLAEKTVAASCRRR